MKRGLILNNAYSALPSSLNQSERLKEEFSRLGVSVDIRRNCVNFGVEKSGEISADFKDYDFCVYLDKDKYAAHMLELTGLRLFNRADAVDVCDDKMLTHIALAGKVPMPETRAGLLCYTPSAELKAELCDEIAGALGYPVIVKECYGSLGRGVYKADNRAELSALAEKLKCVPHLFQKFVKTSAGRDVRVIVIGGKCVAAMLRQSDGDFRSNLELGGKGSPYETDAKLGDICILTAKTLGLDYCGIDVLFGEDGYLVCEVNSNAFFGGIERVTGVNVAREYAEYILRTI